MEIKLLKSKNLEAFLNSEEFRKMPNIPISEHRAISHLKNPALEENDIILLLCYIDDIFAGYLGTLPDNLNIKGKKKHIAWLSCLWVNPQMRRKGVAAGLLSKAHELWEKDLLIVNFTPHAKKAYDKLNSFIEFTSYRGVRTYLRMNLHKLQLQKNPANKKYEFPLKIFDIVFNLFNDLRLMFFNYKKTLKNITAEKINEIDSDTYSLIENHNKNDIVKRDKDSLNWIIKYPWMLQGDPNSKEAKRYEFSSFSKKFKFESFRLKDNENNIFCFLMFNLRDRHLKIPYFYCNSEKQHLALRFIYSYLLKNKVNYLTVFNPRLKESIYNYSSPFFLKRELTRTYLITKKLKAGIPEEQEIIFRDGDGDSAFT